MVRATSSEFRDNIREYQKRAEHEPVEITHHGQRELVLMSADHYDWLRAAAQRAHKTSEALSIVVNAVETAEMDESHRHLDDLLK